MKATSKRIKIIGTASKTIEIKMHYLKIQKKGRKREKRNKWTKRR